MNGLDPEAYLRHVLEYIMYGEGISREGDMLDLAVNQNIVEKSGAWFSYKGERIGQGRENVKQFLRENKDIAARIEAEVRKAIGLRDPAVLEPVPASPEQKAAAAKTAAAMSSRTSS